MTNISLNPLGQTQQRKEIITFFLLSFPLLGNQYLVITLQIFLFIITTI